MNLTSPSSNETSEINQYIFEGRVFDVIKRALYKSDGEVIHLTSTQFDLLKTFVDHPNQVLSRETLFKKTRNRDTHLFDRCIDVHISHLRKILEETPQTPNLIKTVYGQGYIFAARQ